MRSLRRTLVAFLAVAALSAGAVALAQDDPRVPEITSTYTIDRENGYAEICLEINSKRLEGQIFDVEFTGSWAPSITTPPERFGPPGQWQWEPFPGGGWQAKTDTPMSSFTKHCFRLPITSLPDPVTLTASTKTASGQHQALLTFVSKPPDYRNARGDVPRDYRLDGQVEALGVLEPADRRCRPQPLEEQFVLATPRRGVLTIRRPRTGEVASGRVDGLGHFTAAGETTALVGRLRGRQAVVGLRDSRLPACEQSFVGSLALERAGRAAPRCGRPTIIAPGRARVVRGAVRLALGAACAGSPLARWPLAVELRWRGRLFRAGSLRTTIARRRVRVDLGDTRPRELVVRARGGQGLLAAARRIRLVYG